MVELQDINLTAILEDMPFPLIIVDKNRHTIMWANSDAENWFGRSRRSMFGRDLSFITTDIESFQKSMMRVEATGGAVSAHDIKVHTDNGPSHPCNLTIFPYDAGIAILIRPVERTRELSTDRDTDPVEALGRMLAHELKNPLAGIKGAAQLLATEVQSEESQELINLIATETDRIRRLADRMEAFGDVARANKAPVNVHSILRQAMLLAQSSAKDEIVYTEHYDPSLPLVHGDRDSLMQVALNLLVNATEALSLSKQGDEIRLETSYRVGVRRQGDAIALPVEIRVIDNGPGISKNIRGNLFQPFVTDKPAGRGLGLTLVSKIISAHGGIINVSSRPGQTIFSILLPASPDNTTE